MKLRIATFNVENLGEENENNPPIEDRIPVLRPAFRRLNADILCLQEIFSKENPNGDREFTDLNQILQGTKYSNYNVVHTKTGGKSYLERNLLIMSHFDMSDDKQYYHDQIEKMQYKKITANPPENVKDVNFERPIFYTKVNIHQNFIIHVITLHLKSRVPSAIKGQQDDDKPYIWLSNSGWAEGYFLSSMKRVAQALETRILVDQIFDNEPNANIVVCGDFNAHPDEVPVETIRGRVENTSNPELVDRVLMPCGNTIPEIARYSYIHQGEKRLLDHMLISVNMLNYYCGSEIHNETIHDEGIAFAFDTKFPESDHAPFVAQFEIPEN